MAVSNGAHGSDIADTSGVIILKNDAAHLPVTAPASLLLTGNPSNGVRLDCLQTLLRQHWPNCDIQQPSTRHPVRLQTLARQAPLVLLHVVLPPLEKPLLPRIERELITKVACLKQTILVLQSAAPIAMQPWYESVKTLLWVMPGTSDNDLLAVLSGTQPSAAMPFALPLHPGNLQRQQDGSFTQRDEIRPAFAKGFGL